MNYNGSYLYSARGQFFIIQQMPYIIKIYQTGLGLSLGATNILPRLLKPYPHFLLHLQPFIP
jgi:hypothetical protein